MGGAVRRVGGADPTGPPQRFSPPGRRLRPAECGVPQPAVLTGKTKLSPAELRYFTEVDHHDHEAIGAVDQVDGRGLGVAPATSGTLMTHRLPKWLLPSSTTGRVGDWARNCRVSFADRAQQEGIRRFTALVAVDNAGVAGLLKSIDADFRVGHNEPGCVEYEIELPPGGLSDELRTLLRALGRRQDAIRPWRRVLVR